MSKQTTSTFFGLIAGIILLTGIITSVSSLLSYPTVKRQQNKDIESIKLVENLESQFAHLNTKIKPLEDLNYNNLPDPGTLTKSTFGSDKVEYTHQDKKECGSDYVINQVEISLKDISLEKLPAFIRTMESLRPPIVLTSCAITASTTVSGNGDLKLKFKRIEKH